MLRPVSWTQCCKSINPAKLLRILFQAHTHLLSLFQEVSQALNQFSGFGLVLHLLHLLHRQIEASSIFPTVRDLTIVIVVSPYHEGNKLIPANGSLDLVSMRAEYN